MQPKLSFLASISQSQKTSSSYAALTQTQTRNPDKYFSEWIKEVEAQIKLREERQDSWETYTRVQVLKGNAMHKK